MAVLVRDRGRYRSLLLARYTLVVLVGLVLVGVAGFSGYLTLVWEADASKISVGIALLALWAVGVGAWRAYKLGRGLDDRETASKLHVIQEALLVPGRPELAQEALKTRLLSRVHFMLVATSACVTLGLVGTVVGFIVALQGVDPSSVGNVNAIGPMVARLIEGMGIALYTTLTGACVGLWLAVLHQILVTGASSLYAAILEGCATLHHDRE